MISTCEYSIRDYYGVFNIFYSVLFRLDIRYNIQLFSYHSKYQFLQVRTLQKALLCIQCNHTPPPPQINCQLRHVKLYVGQCYLEKVTSMVFTRSKWRDPFNQNSGNFGPKLNGSVRSKRKSFEKTGPVLLRWTTFPGRTGRKFWLNGSHPKPPKFEL